MRVMSRVGMVPIGLVASVVVAAGAVAGLPAKTLASTTASTPADATVTVKDASGRRAMKLAEIGTPYVAVHFTSHCRDGHAHELITEYAAAAPSLAGVSQVFVVPPDDLDHLSTVAFGVNGVAASDDGTAAKALGVEPGADSTVLLTRDGRELLRRSDHPGFAEFAAAADRATRTKAVDDYNLAKDKSLAVEGYDLVAYFADAKAVKGDPRFTSRFRGVRYQFASADHRDRFAKEPEKFLPTYGGWCASAMGAKGTKVEIDPTNFKVKDGRLFLFFKGTFGDALKDWNKHEREWEPAADTNWRKLTGEAPITAEK